TLSAWQPGWSRLAPPVAPRGRPRRRGRSGEGTPHALSAVRHNQRSQPTPCSPVLLLSCSSSLSLLVIVVPHGAAETPSVSKRGVATRQATGSTRARGNSRP